MDKCLLARGRGRDPLGQGPGPGPLGPGAWGPLGPRCGIRVATVTTYCQAGYLPSGKLPTIRQATYCQASYLLSGMHPNVAAYFAPNNRIHAPNRSIDMHPKGIDMHPKVSIYFAPNFRILCTQWGGVHFQKVQYLIVFNLKSQRHIWFMTAFLQCFEFSPKSVLLHFGTS